MALIICTECGKEFSDRAVACPNCGCPTEIILEDIKELEESERIEEEKRIQFERLQREEEERKEREEKEAEEKRKKEEEERRKKEEELLKKAYEEQEENNQQIVMKFPLFGSSVTITLGMKNKVNFYRECEKNRKLYIKQFEKSIQKIQNLNDVFIIGMTKLNDCIAGYISKQSDMLKCYEGIDIELLTNNLLDESGNIVERIVELEFGEFMEDFSRMEGPSPEDTELWTREKYRVYNKYPIKDMLLKCLKDIIEDIQILLVKELAKQSIFIEWQPKQLESVRLDYKEYLQKYKKYNFSLTQLREKMVEILSVDTYNQQLYEDILNLNLIGGEKTNFITICDFLGFNDIYINYQFPDEEEYVKELECARDYLYGRGIPKDSDKARELLEKNGEAFQQDKNFLKELSVIYEGQGDEKLKTVLIERCKIGDIQAAQKIFSEILEKEELYEQVNLYHEVKEYFQTDTFSFVYNKLFSRVKNEIEDEVKKIDCFVKLGDPTNSNDLYYLAKLFEKSESVELWEKAARYYLLASNSNHLNSIFKVFAIVENGILDFPHSRKEIVMKHIMQDDYNRIVETIKQLSQKGNLYAKYLYSTYVCANYIMKNYKMPYIFVDNPISDVEVFFLEYYTLLVQLEEWLKKGEDREVEEILHITKADIAVTVAKYFRKGPAGTVMSDSARRRLEQKYSTIKHREHMALNIQKICKYDGNVSPIIGDFMDGFDKKYSNKRNYYCDLLEIYCASFDGCLKYYAVSPFGDIISESSLSDFLKEVENDYEDIEWSKGDDEYRFSDEKYRTRQVRDLYEKYCYQTEMEGCNFSYQLYGKSTKGFIIRKNKMVIEIQNNDICNEPLILKYIGNCVFGKKDKKPVFFVDVVFKEYDSLDDLLNIKCCDTINDNSMQRKMICPFCNSILTLDVDFCISCGKHQVDKKEVIFVNNESFELLMQVLKNKEYDHLKKMVGDNANICVQYDDGKRDWLLNQVIVRLKDEKIVDYLLKKGADCNSIRDIKVKNGIKKSSPLADAIEYAQSLSIVELLIANGADIYFHRLVESDISEDAPLLNLAIIKSKNYDIIKFLWDLYDDDKKYNSLRYVYNKNCKDKTNIYSLLFDAIEFSNDKEVVQFLLENGYNPNEIRHDEYNIPNKEVPALNSAILWGNPSIVEILLKYGATPNCYRILHEVGGDQKYSALADAMVTNSDRNIDMLLNAGASLDESVLYKNKMIKLQKYPLKKSELSSKTIKNLKRHGWQPPIFSF